ALAETRADASPARIELLLREELGARFRELRVEGLALPPQEPDLRGLSDETDEQQAEQQHRGRAPRREQRAEIRFRRIRPLEQVRAGPRDQRRGETVERAVADQLDLRAFDALVERGELGGKARAAGFVDIHEQMSGLALAVDDTEDLLERKPVENERRTARCPPVDAIVLDDERQRRWRVRHAVRLGEYGARRQARRLELLEPAFEPRACDHGHRDHPRVEPRPDREYELVDVVGELILERERQHLAELRRARLRQ